ncbi:serine/threonine-protein phosphatase 6 regulatory subunit 3-like isoform X2 [Watersipora subatra]|uniref:serine/threonine-protein phosphatase 6 regulatory subunit 3-like isoform X2 n=1 Tax=Watersipora subatra TaxID=2589382 RepID=UPI00355B1545
MFWRYNALTSHIDTLLEKESVTLHELMDEDDILQECKGQNHKLIDFLITPEVMEELVQLITCEPSEEVEDKVRYKYPNIACELLTSDVSQILDKLVEDNILIDKIYAFMLRNEQLNPLLASFFTKVLGLLLLRKADYLFDYLTSKDDFLGNLLSHIGTSAIMDLLMRLVTYEPMYETKAKILKWMDEQALVPKLVGLIHKDKDDEDHYNAASVLCDIVRFGREQLGSEVPQADPLLDIIESERLIGDLLSNMLEHTPSSESVITNGLLVIQTILEYRRQMPEGCIEPLPQVELERMGKATMHVLSAVKPRIAQLAAILSKPPQSQTPMLTTIGVLDPPLGNTRLQVCRLFATLFSVDDEDLQICLIENNVMNRLLDLFFQYTWNNFLHAQVELSISNVLNRAARMDAGPKSSDDENGKFTPTTVTQEEDTPLVTHLFKDCKIISRMVDAWRENEEAVAAGSQRRGYMGHVTKVCNTIVSASEKGAHSSLITTLLQDMEDSGGVWSELITTQLAETNKKNTSDLVGAHPLNSSSGSESDSDFKDIPFPQDDAMQQAFSDYQIQQLTSTFIDQFGLSDKEFAPSTDSRIEAQFNQPLFSLDWSPDTSTKEPKEYMARCDMVGSNSDEDEDMWKDKEVVFNRADASVGSAPSSSAALPSSDSDSSDDELVSSPALIKSKNEPSMEIDSINADSVIAPVAMDTSPWETVATKAGGEDEEWTAFEGADDNNSSDSTGWADFSNLDSAPALDGGPRVSSPDALSNEISANTETQTNVAKEELAGSKSDKLPQSSDSCSQDENTVPSTSQGNDSVIQPNDQIVTTKDASAVSMEVDEMAMEPDLSSGKLASPAPAPSSEIEVPLPGAEESGGGDSSRSERNEINGLCVKDNEEEQQSNGPI